MRSPRALIAYAWRRALHNLPYKAAALLIAVGLWFVATGERRATSERAFTTQLRVLDVTETNGGSRRLTSGLPQTVRVTLRGPRTPLAALSSDEVEASVNVTDVPEGAFQRPIRVRPPEGFRVVRYDPTVASGFVDTELSRTLPVQLALTNLPERALPRFQLTPKTARLTGPSRVVNTVASVTTVPVSLPRGASAEVRLIALDGGGRPVTDVRLDPTSVSVERTDAGDLPIKTLPVTLPDPPPNLDVVTAEINPPSVRVLGDAATLAALPGVTARVPYHEGQYSARATFALPGDARSLDAVTVTLDVRKRGARP